MSEEVASQIRPLKLCIILYLVNFMLVERDIFGAFAPTYFSTT